MAIFVSVWMREALKGFLYQLKKSIFFFFIFKFNFKVRILVDTSSTNIEVNPK